MLAHTFLKMKQQVPKQKFHRVAANAIGRKRIRGAVIIEMAVCLPLMLLVVFGCIEVSSGIFRGQTLTSAAHEGALVGLKPNATEQDIANRVSTVMAARGISDFTMQINTFGVGFENLQSGERFRIELATEINNSYLTNREVGASVTALRP